ncbi:MAG: hypothetical protein V7750_19720 [Sneathiella sp.]
MRKTVIPDTAPVREAVGIFSNVESLYDCVEELQTNGFDRSDITLLDHPHLTNGLSRNSVQDTHMAEDSPTAIRGPFIDPQSLGDAEGALIGVPLYIFTIAGAGITAAYGGSIAMIITAASIMGVIGACIGGGAAYWLKRRHDAYYTDQIEHGGIPLWIHTKDEKHEKQAVKALETYNADDVHIHDLKDLPYEVREGRTTAYHIIH